MKKLQILIVVFLISLSICAFTIMQVKAQDLTVSVLPISGSMDVGQSMTFTATVSGGTSPYTYQWFQIAPGASSYSAISGATSSIYSFATTSSSAAGVWSFELQVTDGASTPVVVTSAAVSVTVDVAPTVSVSPTSATLNVGQSQTFTATALGGSGTYSSYQWYVGGVAQSAATAATFSYSPAASGSYSITVTVTDSLGTISAQSTAATVTVSASPTVSITPVGPLSMNVGQIQTFTATASGGSGTLTYQWYVDGTAVGSNSASYSYTASAGTNSVTCKVTDSASTPVTSPASNAVSVTVNSALVAPTVTATPGTVDQGQTSSLTSTAVSTGTSPYTYQWLEKAPGGSFSPISGATSTSYNFVTSGSTATGSWSFEIQVTDAAGAQVTSTAATVTVNAALLNQFVFSSVGTQTAGTSFSITVTAEDAYGKTITSYTGINTLSVSTGTISPTSTGAFSSGVWTGTVTVTGAGSGVTISTSGSGMSGTSGGFTVNPSVLNHFTFSTISSPQIASYYITVTVTAEDAYGNTVTSYTGTPSLTYSAGSISPSVMNAFVNGVGTTTVIATTAGSGVTITATDGTHTGTSNSFTVNPTISASAGANGAISPSGTFPVNYGSSQSFTITPNAGYYIDSVMVNGVSVGAVTSYTFTNVQASDNIYAGFTLTPPSTTTSPTSTSSSSPTATPVPASTPTPAHTPKPAATPTPTTGLSSTPTPGATPSPSQNPVGLLAQTQSQSSFAEGIFGVVAVVVMVAVAVFAFALKKKAKFEGNTSDEIDLAD